MATQTKTKNAPVYKGREGRLQVSIFEDTSKDGKIRFSTYIQRLYKSADGQWKTGAFSGQDLDDLAKARDLALAQIKRRTARYSKQQRG